MSYSLDASIKGWDRTFLDLSSKMAEPLCSVWGLLRYRLVAPLDPKKFDNFTNQITEIAFRTLILLGACLGAYICAVMPIPMLFSVAALGISSRLFRAIGFALQQGGYTHVRGTTPEKTLNSQAKVMTWNLCGFAGGLNYDHGGVIDWRSRLPGIVNKLTSEDPDVIIFQEVYDTALAEALIKKLSTNYAHFFMHLGPNALGSVGGCMVITKCAVHDFSHTSFTNNSWTLNRGFATLELKRKPQDLLPCARIIGSHFIHGDDAEAKKNRAQQIAQVANSVATKTLSLPTVLAGDLNMERDAEEGALLSFYLRHSYQGKISTCTNRLNEQWDPNIKNAPEETIDYISFFKRMLSNGKKVPIFNKNIRMENCHLIKAFNTSYSTRTALSDHHGMVVNLSF